MSNEFAIALIVIVGVIVAAIMHARATSRITPVLEAAAIKHNATVRRSAIGLPQIYKTVDGRVFRMTPMNKSTSSAGGGGAMTCVDFETLRSDVSDFRIREKADYRRNALPRVLMGADQPFTLEVPELEARFRGVGSNADQARRIIQHDLVVKSILALPPGADIRVQGGKCYISVDGLPDDIDFVDRLFSASELTARSIHESVHGGLESPREASSRAGVEV